MREMPIPLHVSISNRLKHYFSMVKPYQTLMLVFTGLVGYLTAAQHVRVMDLVNLLGSMFLTVSGATLLNMWYDHDIDSVMERTKGRPIPSGDVPRNEVFYVALLMSGVGLVWSFLLGTVYGVIALTGFFFNVFVYTFWTKRRTPWSIIWGGVAGAMPIMGGRVYALGYVDRLAILMALIVLLWVPVHNITFEVKYREDYAKAGVPVLPNTHGLGFSMALVPFFILLTSLAMLLTAFLLKADAITFFLVVSSSLLFFAVSILKIRSPDSRSAFILFKLASSYMFLSLLALLL